MDKISAALHKAASFTGMDWNSCVTNGVATLNCVPIIFVNIINGLLTFSAVTALAFIILSGYKLMNSGGDQKKVSDAKNTLTFAIVGLVIVFGAFFIVNSVSDFTNVPCIKEIGFGNCK